MADYNFKELETIMANWAADHGLETEYNFVEPSDNNIVFISNGIEMLKVCDNGFFVRGKPVPVDDKEAETVYNALKEFLVWSRLNRE